MGLVEKGTRKGGICSEVLWICNEKRPLMKSVTGPKRQQADYGSQPERLCDRHKKGSSRIRVNNTLLVA